MRGENKDSNNVVSLMGHRRVNLDQSAELVFRSVLNNSLIDGKPLQDNVWEALGGQDNWIAHLYNLSDEEFDAFLKNAGLFDAIIARMTKLFEEKLKDATGTDINSRQ